MHRSNPVTANTLFVASSNTEDGLFSQEARFKALVSQGRDMIVIIDVHGKFLYISENVTALLGYSPSDLIGKNAFDFIHKADAEKVFLELQKVIDRNHASGTQHRFLNSNGDWTWLESKGSNHLSDASVNGIIINARDITERMRLQLKLDEERANRQKQITAAVIEAQERERSQLGLELHDNVNQVLTTIKLYNEMLLEGIGDQKDILTRSVRHLQSCINEIRSISKRLSAPTLGKIDLHESIKELVDSINLTNRINIDYSISGLKKNQIGQDLHLAIYRIIQEQLNNIIKYAEAKYVSLRITIRKNNLVLTICDNGKGFDIHEKRTGIGIINMSSRAEHMGGKLQIRSSPGNGCRLMAKFKLPE